MAITEDEVERYAAVRAAIDLGTDKESALRADGQTLDAWTLFEASVLEEVAEQVDRGETDALVAFQRAYDAKVGPRPHPEPQPQPQPPTTPIIEDTAPAAPAPLLGDQTDVVDGRAIREQLLAGPLPFDPGAAPAIRIKPAEAVVPSGETIAPNKDVIEALLDKGALPFGSEARPAVAQPAAAQPAAPPSRAVEQSGTTIAPSADVIQSLLRGGALPFGSEQRPPSAPLAPMPPGPPPQPSTELAKTEQLPSPAEIEAAVALVKARREDQRRAELASRATTAPRADAGKAAVLPFSTTMPKAEPALMPLEKYAEISATLEKEGNPMKTFSRIGATPESWMALVLAYSKRFAADKALEAQFDALMKKHRR